MKKYRLGYDYIILSDRPFEYKANLIISLSIDVLFKVFDENKEEVFFESEKLIDQAFDFGNGNTYYLNELIKYSFDAKDGLVSLPNFELVPRINNHVFQFEVKSYYKDIQGELPEGLNKVMPNFPYAERTEITKEEFMNILWDNINLFDIAYNSSFQSTAYFTEEQNCEAKRELKGRTYNEMVKKNY